MALLMELRHSTDKKYLYGELSEVPRGSAITGSLCYQILMVVSVKQDISILSSLSITERHTDQFGYSFFTFFVNGAVNKCSGSLSDY